MPRGATPGRNLGKEVKRGYSVSGDWWKLRTMTGIDVRCEAGHEAPMMRGGRPMLTWGHHLFHGNGWTL